MSSLVCVKGNKENRVTGGRGGDAEEPAAVAEAFLCYSSYFLLCIALYLY